MVRESKYMLMVISMKECLNKVKEVVKALITFLMVKFTKANGIMVKYKDLEYVNGQMERPTRVSGSTIRKMESVISNGQMADNIEVRIETIRNTVKELTFGLMVENTLESGKMIKDMVRDNMLLAKNKAKKAFGNKTRE